MCWPLGIVPLIYALRANHKWKNGDYEGAVVAGEKAKGWTMTVALLLIIFALVVLLSLLGSGDTMIGFM